MNSSRSDSRDSPTTTIVNPLQVKLMEEDYLAANTAAAAVAAHTHGYTHTHGQNVGTRAVQNGGTGINSRVGQTNNSNNSGMSVQYNGNMHNHNNNNQNNSNYNNYTVDEAQL